MTDHNSSHQFSPVGETDKFALLKSETGRWQLARKVRPSNLDSMVGYEILADHGEVIDRAKIMDTCVQACPL